MSIERNLPLSDTYHVIGIRRQSIEDCDVVLACDNCNAAIVNIGHIKNQHGKSFHVGLDCLKTLLGSVNNRRETDDYIYDFNTTVRELATVNKHLANGSELIDNEIMWSVKYRTPKGGRSMASVYKSYLERFNLPSPA